MPAKNETKAADKPTLLDQIHGALAGQILFDNQYDQLKQLAGDPPKNAEEFRTRFNAIVQPGTLQAAQQANIDALIGAENGGKPEPAAAAKASDDEPEEEDKPAPPPPHKPVSPRSR